MYCPFYIAGTSHQHTSLLPVVPAEKFGVPENEDLDVLQSADPTPVTPLYMKRTFYDLVASEEEDSGQFIGNS